jgi:transcription antitermination factor NusG
LGLGGTVETGDRVGGRAPVAGVAVAGPAAVASAQVQSPAWYAVQTKPRQEERVLYWIRRRAALPVFLPKVEQLRRRGARRLVYVEPLFPSYVFVQMALEPHAWQAVKWAPGVRRILGTDDVPTPVPPEAMRLLRERCDGDEVVRWAPAFRKGEAVRVVHGPFEGLVGILERPATRTHRVRVLLQLLGCPTPVELDVADIERVA